MHVKSVVDAELSKIISNYISEGGILSLRVFCLMTVSKLVDPSHCVVLPSSGSYKELSRTFSLVALLKTKGVSIWLNSYHIRDYLQFSYGHTANKLEIPIKFNISHWCVVVLMSRFYTLKVVSIAEGPITESSPETYFSKWILR